MLNVTLYVLVRVDDVSKKCITIQRELDHKKVHQTLLFSATITSKLGTL